MKKRMYCRENLQEPIFPTGAEEKKWSEDYNVPKVWVTGRTDWERLLNYNENSTPDGHFSST